MKTDEQLKQDVQAELNWDPSINDSGIVISAKEGVVTLAGHVPFYADKVSAEKAAKTVSGVRGVANDIEVKPNMAHQRSDSDIAESAVNALRASVAVPADDVKVLVRDGWITLEGNVAFRYQKSAAESAVRSLWGVKGITNSISITSSVPAVSPTIVRSKIQSAYQRHAAIDANKVRVDVLGSTVTLTGEVHSWHEKDDAENAAWAAPGVKSVHNHLCVVTL
ncbi:BON domain-containing protein [Peristeroidobacter soli]|jgi:osmotically-inducible protein OsmY|uniref:BON domain-containing protein n=1 Tax=Peristeroidobacter soli TaxID=2497877 RepID=UPI00101DE61F|nr:BON domain-containing protein [Peristeroidobacter soli]